MPTHFLALAAADLSLFAAVLFMRRRLTPVRVRR